MKVLIAALSMMLLISASAYQTCKLEKEDLLQTGNIQFNNDGSGKQNCYTVNINYDIPNSGIQTALSTEDLQGYRPSEGLDYSVRANKKNNANALSLSFLSRDKGWKKVTVSYLATSRSDIQAGSFISDAYTLLGCDTKTNSDIISYSIAYGPKIEYQVATFISGIKTENSNLDVQLSGGVYNSKQGAIEVKITTNSKPLLQNVHISYIIWNKQSKLTVQLFNPLSSTVVGDYEILGATEFSKTIQNRQGLAIISDRLFCKGSGCISSQCVTIGQCSKNGGVQLPKSRDCLICGTYEKIQNYNCVPNCKKNELFSNGICVCAPGFTKIIGECIWTCGVNEIWKGGKCVCDDGFAKLGGVCRNCPSYSKLIGDKCVCNSGYKFAADQLTCELICGANEINVNGKCQCDNDFVNYNGSCVKCPAYSTLVASKCVCHPGYNFNKQKFQCDLICGQNEIAFNNKCVCADQFVRVNGECKSCPAYSNYKLEKCVCQIDYEWNDAEFKCYPSIPTCPPKSKWNQKKLVCECEGVNEYLIDGLCRRCSVNQVWNGQKCACVSGYQQINGVCRTCDPNSSYNGRDCICNHGFYGNADKCEKCDSSCGKCSGPKNNQCITCSDVSFDFKDGYCTRNIPCPTGLFLEKDSCKPCSSYCGICESENICKTCITGFKLEQLNFYGQKASYCSEICGDGKRFEVDCDDGNNRDGDGCNKNCQVEKGFHCQGGSSIKPSTCVSYIPDRSYISTTGTVHLFGRVVQGIRLSYIPAELTANQCALCSKLLWVRVIDSKVVPGVRINYLPKSQYQFLAEFQFNGLFAIPVFAISIQINPDYAKYFSASDLAQIQVKRIDPAVLVKKDQVQTLTDDIFADDNKIKISDSALAIVTSGTK